MRFFSTFTAFFIFFSSISAYAADDIELLNSTLVTKLHFATKPDDGQMVGAYQISFRNETGTPLSRVTMLINPGLQFLRATGSKGENLRASSNLQTIQALAPLQLNTIRITLAAPLDNTDRTEITVHYKGYLDDLSAYGLTGVQETLHPDFTMIRAQSFGYPVMATPDLADIERAFAHKPFRQVAFIEYPGVNDITGSLDVASKTLNGNRTDVEMKSARPTPLMSIAIAPFRIAGNDAARIAYLHDSQSGPASAFATKIMSEKQRITGLLGAPANDEMIRIVGLPADYMPASVGTAFFTRPDFFNTTNTALPARIQQSLTALWQPTGYGRPGHWSNGIHNVIAASLQNSADVTALGREHFIRVKASFDTSPDLGRTPLSEYTINGFTSEADPVSGLAYAALHDMMGRTAFFDMTRSLYAETSGSYTDTEVVADFMEKNISDRKVRKFVKSWFSGTKAGRDMDKSETFEALLNRYK